MNVIDRLNNRIYKSYRKSSVEYHAGGFFIRKDALYMKFLNNSLVIIERPEGLHPYDNKYSELFNNNQNIQKISEFSLKTTQENLAIYESEGRELKIMPSIFIQNISDEEITEILVDYGNQETLVFSRILSS